MYRVLALAALLTSSYIFKKYGYTKNVVLYCGSNSPYEVMQCIKIQSVVTPMNDNELSNLLARNKVISEKIDDIDQALKVCGLEIPDIDTFITIESKAAFCKM